MFFLGAGFMLLETKTVVQLALLFGSTWFVNSMVFFTVLLLALLANLFVIKWPPARLRWHYAGLFAILVGGVLVPLSVFLSGGLLWRYVAPRVLALGPMFFAGVIFATSFRDFRSRPGFRIEYRWFGLGRPQRVVFNADGISIPARVGNAVLHVFRIGSGGWTHP